MPNFSKETAVRAFFGSSFIFLVVMGTLSFVDFGVGNTVDKGDWPMLQHDASRSGYSTSNAPYTNVTLWNHTTHSSYSSPAVAEGRVYIASIVGVIYCFNSTTGIPIWIFDTGSTNNMQDVVPAVTNSRLYIGAGANVYCLDAIYGSLIWNYSTGAGIIQSSPAVDNGKVYIGSIDKNMYCLDAATGKLIWNFTTGGAIYCSPAVANGAVYFGSYQYDYNPQTHEISHNIYALNASTGALIWSGVIFLPNSPVYSDGKVYFGSKDGSFTCFDASKGNYEWIYMTGGEITGSAAVANGKVYFGSHDKQIYCLDKNTGRVIWNYRTDDWISGGAPAVADGRVYIGSTDNKIYCLEANEGWVIWSYDTQTPVGTSPAIANGIVYANSFDTLYAFIGSSDSPKPTPRTTPSPSPSPNPTSAFADTSTPVMTPKPTLTPKTPQSPLPIIQVKTNNGIPFNFTISGNITTSQISNAIITINQSNKTAQLSFSITGQSGVAGFSNITIPKNAVSFGKSLTVLIDDQPAELQGYTQDAFNYFVWYTTYFSSHRISIVFASDSIPSSMTVTPEMSQGKQIDLTLFVGLAFGIVVVGVAVATLVIVTRKR